MGPFLNTRKPLLSSVQLYLKLNANSPNYIQLSEGARHSARYAYFVDGLFPDPASRSQPYSSHGFSQTVNLAPSLGRPATGPATELEAR